MQLPSGVVPSLNATVPAAAAGATVAVRVTGEPNGTGFGIAASERIDGAFATVWKVVALEPARVASPAYVAEIDREPTASVQVPIGVVPSLIATLPAATVPSPLETETVNVTSWPKVAFGMLLESVVVVTARPTTWVPVVELGERSPSPPYRAVIVRVPSAIALVASEQVPPVSVQLPIGVVPSLNATVPVAVPLVATTVAASVTDAPSVEGFGLVTSVVVVVALTTETVVAPLLSAWVASPAYRATIERVPTGSELATTWQEPASSVQVPSGVVPSETETVPAGVEPSVATVIVRATAVPSATVGEDATTLVVVGWRTTWTRTGEVLGAWFRSPA